MKYDDICTVVARRASVDRVRSDRVVKATLQALSEQADPQLFAQVLEHLPAEFAKTLTPEQQVTRRDLDEFLARVATLSGTSAWEVRRPVLAAVAALTAAVPQGFESLLASLGQEYVILVPPPAEMLDEQVFVDTVRQRGAFDSVDQAMTATRATLVALAERITAGQASDLAGYLPPTLRPHLEAAGVEAQPFDYTAFLARISGQRELAETSARAVLSAVREAAPEPEINNTLAQLPDDLARLFT